MCVVYSLYTTHISVEDSDPINGSNRPNGNHVVSTEDDDKTPMVKRFKFGRFIRGI